MSDPVISISKATQADLPVINEVIKAAIMQWNLPERVKRLSLPSYFYNEFDLAHFDIIVAKESENIIAVASLEHADKQDTPGTQVGLLLHGLYVHPNKQNMGTGKLLLDAAEKAVRDKGLNGLLVKAQADAIGYFVKQGFTEVKMQNASRDYAHRYWKAVSG